MGSPDSTPKGAAAAGGAGNGNSRVWFADGQEADDVEAPAATKPSLKRVQTNAALLRDIDVKNRLTVEFSDVCASVPVMFNAGGGGGGGVGSTVRGWMRCLSPAAKQQEPNKQDAKERQVLFNLTGCIEPGEVLALMGPSGSGKSSLLSVIGGRSTARTSGDVTFGGKKLSKAIKRKLGYVMQDDMLFAELTVYETLYYAAMLRLPRSWSRADKLSRVEMVIAGLGLDRCRDTIIGSHMMRGVSGGERKRVSIGHELLINPSVIFLDEPTSGLDSTTALRLMHTLRSLASGGRTIVTSIHQPSSRLYKQMDKLMLLSEGHCMYYGDAHVAVTWFERLGQACPFGTNIADHILDLANGDVVTGGADNAAGQEATPEATTQLLTTAFEKRSAAGLGKHGLQAADLEADGAATSDASRGSADASLVASGVAIALMEDDSAGSPTALGVEDGKWGASWIDQVTHLTARSLKTRRFQSLSVQKFAQLLVVALLSGMFWWQIGGSLEGEQQVLDIGGLLFFIELFMAFASLFAALFTFPQEFQMLVKERQSGMYRLSAYYLARTLSDLPMDCLLPSLFTWIVYWMSGLRVTPGAFFGNWASVLLLVLTAQSFGLLIGATVMDPQNGQTIATIYMLATMLVGGYYVRGIPVWIAWLKYASFIYWGWNLLLKIEFVHRAFPCSGPPAPTPPPPGGLLAADLARCDVSQAGIFDIDVNEPVTKEVLILLAMLIVLRLGIYYALQYKTTFKGKK